MDESNETPRRYIWPWFVLAAFVLAVVLAVVFMCFAVKREREQRNFNAPIQTR
jgi:autotransporter translocation and assembly factor TamB